MKQDDRNRSVRLLWEPDAQVTREPKAALSRARVVEAAIKVADAEGIGALTMRRVAETLGFTTMSLYRHVPGKSELLDLMVDAVWGETEHTPKGPWRAGLEFYARQMWSMYRAHPWLLQLTNARRMPGPNAMTRQDAAFAVVSELGLKPEEIVAVVTTVGQFVAGVGRTMADRVLAERETGVSEEDWWNDRDELWEHFTPERLPMMTHIWTTGGYERPLDEFEFGLARVLDGLEVFISAEDRPVVRRETCL
ncbi:TetR/AcrR family transcriptional regulator [Lentzea flava]|uniref:TetR family transcriptional regulator n=1 Tax=Lentzea flava TaxID=103732 RepID=A0ABQ2UXJ4_9PSEU|nr:TetR/AcrR family transcriptional regulator [Lentzea flava]MCP2202278.1 transcriptional regulator, TetR family [Lentzea flava]GGU58581.1 TetR family transcriptional regulator [Lentzea flava]